MKHSAGRDRVFRIPVRKYDAFERAIAEQWKAFESADETGLVLEAVPMELHDLQQAIFGDEGLQSGAWDVAFVPTDWIPALHASGSAADLAPLIAQNPPEGYPDAWSPSLLRLQQIGDSILGVPYHDGPECLMYRTDLFKDAENQRRFYERYQTTLRPPKTWSEFHRIARFFHNPGAGIYGTAFAAYPDGHNTVYDFLLQLWTRGGEIAHGDSLRFNTPAAVEALSFYREILREQAAIHPESRSLDSVAAGMRFAAGEIALMVNWFGFAVHAHTSADSEIRGRVDIDDVPAKAGCHSVSLNVYWILALACGSPHREAAWRFLHHTQSAAMDMLTTTSGAIGCRKSTWTNPEVNASIPFYCRMESLHASARELPHRVDWPQIAEIIDSLMNAAINTSEPIETLLRKADEAIAAEN